MTERERKTWQRYDLFAQANGGRIEIHSPDRDGVIATLVAPAVTAESNEIPPHGV